MANDKFKILLISPKGPLYRHRGGIFGQTLRYMPLTLPTLTALVPPELNAEVVCLDEGTGDVDPARIEADLIGLTVITGTAMRAYELAAAFREAQHPSRTRRSSCDADPRRCSTPCRQYRCRLRRR